MTLQVSWANIEQALVNWLSPAFVPTNSVMFLNQLLPKLPFPYVSCILIGSSREGGRDQIVETVDLTRALNILATVTVQSNATYTITINGTPYTFTSGGAATANQITAGLKTALSGSGLTVTDNHNGTLTLVGTTVFNITTTANLSWSNLDNGHEVVFTTEGSRRLVYSFAFNVDKSNLMAGGAYALAESARASLSQESVVQSLMSQGLMVVKDNGVRDTSLVVNGQWYNVSTLDVVFRTLVTVTEDTGYVGSIVATDNVDFTPPLVVNSP